MDNELRDLALSVARCPEVECARGDFNHKCHKIVSLQDPDEFQVPEGWAGNLSAAKICFVSSNPSISEPPDGDGWDQAENYPRGDWSNDDIADFTINRFNGRWATKDGRHKKRGVGFAKPTKFWMVARQRASEVLGREADPTQDYVMTEVVHCKSKREVGVARAAPLCVDRHFESIIAASAAPLVVVVGSKARDRLRKLWLEDIPHDFGTRAVNGTKVAPNVVLRDLGRSTRLVVYLTHVTSMEKVLTFHQHYGAAGVAELTRLLRREVSVDQAAEHLQSMVIESTWA